MGFFIAVLCWLIVVFGSLCRARQVVGYLLFFCKSKQHKVLKTDNFPSWASCRSRWTTKALLFIREERGGGDREDGESDRKQLRDWEMKIESICKCVCGCVCVRLIPTSPISHRNRGVWFFQSQRQRLLHSEVGGSRAEVKGHHLDCFRHLETSPLALIEVMKCGLKTCDP